MPGGGLFVPRRHPDSGGGRGGWWRFAPGAEPVRIGARQPAPAWQAAIEHVPASTSGGCVVEQIPAGLLARSGTRRRPRRRPVLRRTGRPARPHRAAGRARGRGGLVGRSRRTPRRPPRGRQAPGPAGPGSTRDILRTGQAAADRLDVELVVHTGMPLLSYGTPTEPGTVRSVLVGADGAPAGSRSWTPWCASRRAATRPPGPRLLRWSPPVAGPGAEYGVVRLSETWGPRSPGRACGSPTPRARRRAPPARWTPRARRSRSAAPGSRSTLRCTPCSASSSAGSAPTCAAGPSCSCTARARTAGANCAE
ncbi:hypothetical protein NKH77_29035 [Streptomyces sp. M19]